MPSARDNRNERDRFYKQLGEQAKLNHTFVVPKTSPNMPTFGGSASRSGKKDGCGCSGSSFSVPPPTTAPLSPFPRHYDQSVPLDSRAFSIPTSQLTEASHLPPPAHGTQAPSNHSHLHTTLAQAPMAATWYQPATQQVASEWDQ